MSERSRGVQDGGLPPHPRTTGYRVVRVLAAGGLVVAVATWLLFSDRSWAGPVGLVAALVGLVCVTVGFVWRMTAVDSGGGSPHATCRRPGGSGGAVTPRSRPE